MLLLAQEPGGPWKTTESARRTARLLDPGEYQALVAIAAFLGQGTEKS